MATKNGMTNEKTKTKLEREETKKKLKPKSAALKQIFNRKSIEIREKNRFVINVCVSTCFK